MIKTNKNKKKDKKWWEEKEEEDSTLRRPHGRRYSPSSRFRSPRAKCEVITYRTPGEQRCGEQGNASTIGRV
jgi:hypothetical protein